MEATRKAAASSDEGGERETAGNADPKFRRILWAALLANIAMFFVESAASIVSGSVALQADALDFLGDSANYAISLFVLGMGLRARATASLVKSAGMAVFGLWVIGSAVHRLLTGTPPDPVVMGLIGFVALIVNFSVAAMLYRYRSGDSNMRSIWLCSRNDAIGNIAVMLAAGGVLVTASVWPDLVVAAIVAMLELSASLQVIPQARLELRRAARNSSADETPL
ncbi:MAG: cation transporter [Gammaproteobacteria bacterium]|nr:cation transporter [Gammaproteobacteria bacterium]